MTGSDDSDDDAAAWFARMRGPDAAWHRAAFEAWRAAHPRDAADYRRLDENWRRSHVLHESEALDAFRLRPPWWRRLQLDRPRVYAPALAVLVLVIVLGIWAAGATGSPVAPNVAMASQVGERRTLTLADGSRVTLDTDSAVTPLFTAGQRGVRLDRGRARFDVVHDASRPFVVLAAAARITDLGTVFDVRLRDRRVDVVLLRGSVAIRSVSPSAAPRPAALLRLVAGQQATVPADGPPAIASTPASQRSTWVSGMLDFDEATLSDMLAEINRYNARHIVAGDPRLASLRVTGTFRATDPAGVAQTLAALFDLRVQTDRQGNWILLPK